MALTYITTQQRAVLSAIRTVDGATAATLTEELHRRGEQVGLTTVYRQLEKLVQKGMVHKIIVDDTAHYQYCTAHERDSECFMLLCERCGRVEHADCRHLGELYAHLLTEHRFAVNPRRTLFYGLCEHCSQEAAR